MQGEWEFKEQLTIIDICDYMCFPPNCTSRLYHLFGSRLGNKDKIRLCAKVDLVMFFYHLARNAPDQYIWQVNG